MKQGTIRSFTDLTVWQEAHKLVLLVYRLTEIFPKKETFNLISQMRRCVVSITSNIAEGFNRRSLKEKIQFYTMAQSSLTELQNQLLIARDIGYMPSEVFNRVAELTITVHKLLTGLIKSTKLRAT